MVAVAVLVSVVAGARTGKADARLGASTETALAVYEDRLAQAREDARAVGRDEALAEALRAGDGARARGAAARLRGELGLATVTVLDRSGSELASAGQRDGVAVSELSLRGPEGTIGAVSVASASARRYAAEVERLTGRRRRRAARRRGARLHGRARRRQHRRRRRGARRRARRCRLPGGHGGAGRRRPRPTPRGLRAGRIRRVGGHAAARGRGAGSILRRGAVLHRRAAARAAGASRGDVHLPTAGSR